jgi:hypothetical protein
VRDNQHDHTRLGTSSYSGPQNVCVELSVTTETTKIRDTKHRTGGILTLPAISFDALLTTIRFAP